MTSFTVTPVRARKIIAARNDLFSFLASMRGLKNGDIVALTSKVVSLSEGRSVPKEGTDRDAHIETEADQFVPRARVPGGYGYLTIKNHALTASAGVDEFDGLYILWPKNPASSAGRIQKYLRKKHRLQKLGVVITDSHTVPLRRGKLGFALAWAGFAPLRSYRGQKNLHGRTMKMTQANVADALAAAAVLAMGEGGERTPAVIISDVEGAEFQNTPYRPAGKFASFEVPVEEDIFQPLLQNEIWRQRKRKSAR